MTRDLSSELDTLKQQVAELQAAVQHWNTERRSLAAYAAPPESLNSAAEAEQSGAGPGSVFYSGHARLNGQSYRWEPQERPMEQLLEVNNEKSAKVLAALSNRQRLDILKSVIQEPLTGIELVERLGMGTTGQLYHHLKALTGADLLVQESGGRYAFPSHRLLPFLLLLASVSTLEDTSDYMDTMRTRNNAGIYLGPAQNFDVHHLLWAVIENPVMEHAAGYCSEIGIFLHDDGSVTVTDNGRGIPVASLPNSNIPAVQSILTDIHRFNGDGAFKVPGAEQGISIAVVNALSGRLTVDIRRGGRMYRQEYRHGVPQSGLMTVGIAKDTGTSVTFKPDQEFLGTGFEQARLNEHSHELMKAYPGLSIFINN
ncbi:ATP-binding protein [Paenibacillus sp. FSL R7-0297]|uniref:ATP-binding protein n=1 Tax=unclassified Paenibacillus TaxID=185978 RepID=UPI0004F81919|nr:ATP-binding protein [Paenibacillus sp. FSL R5-0912]AIQ39418.1 ArsR family transcriptional regulator [Paenibacillus sp. FSL R5-0912]